MMLMSPSRTSVPVSTKTGQLQLQYQPKGEGSGTLNVLMEGTPGGLELAAEERAITGVPGVMRVHDLHIWSISSSDLALSAHIEADDTALSEANALLVSLKEMLWSEFGVGHVTLELECLGGSCARGVCTLASE